MSNYPCKYESAFTSNTFASTPSKYLSKILAKKTERESRVTLSPTVISSSNIKHGSCEVTFKFNA